MRLPALYVILDVDAAAHDPLALVQAVCAGGGRMLQLRAKTRRAPEVRALAMSAAALMRDVGGVLLLNGAGALDAVSAVRASVGDAVAVGVHRPASGPSWAEVRGVLGDAVVCGASAHDAAELEEAGAGASFATISPVFLTRSKPGYGPALGLDGLARFAASAALPVYALGGVTTPERARACVVAGARGVAVMGAIIRADDPEAVTRGFVSALA